ncbi:MULTISPECIES: DUF4192 domain-containing protein [Mycobacteriaceae]|uniref:DUF4192 domain-containing protein n=1 Tax=Mycolicibacterium neoaurum VKM Ac-1815D TaxID=700508 RepID=V5XB76_MYCNE|nr:MULTISPECIES: DUF4192 domain-containing protein [Mycobacteriaceae]AHC25272.1 hypothetical protein D174_12015 [Mycolicibacterium neoaurum VKM Ac-1815D]AMO08285.1 hypothetical protein MyAD_11795 [Mycolicibacterium neoaurum]AXK78389.1 DUF4192 domain-containing protein [Mycolicibacterium neoaurum]KJQ49542.1 hypothetical protein TS71_15680 [Mycolicibacterium neoaurum]KUM09185.1 hypothetical protein AVZ31_07525 [Mycolicibacterium neoaurum]
MTQQPRGFDVGRPASLIAALPAVLGFVPENSLTIVTLDGGEMGCVMRVDLSPGLLGNTTALAEVVAGSGHDGAVAVIVDEDGADHGELADDLAVSMSREGVDLLAVLAVDRIAADGRWFCVCGCGAHGVIDDPDCSPLAAEAVLGGRRLYRRRDELRAVVTTTDAARGERLGQVLRSARRGQLSAAAARRAIEAAMTLARAVATGQQPADADIVVVVGALRDPRVRDTLYALAVGDAAAAAETLWATLARLVPVPWRQEVLTLLAFSAYARGDGPLAGIALEEAVDIDPTHRMATMLDCALQSGMRPEQIRELALSGYRIAGQLGIRLPPRLTFGRRAG